MSGYKPDDSVHTGFTDEIGSRTTFDNNGYITSNIRVDRDDPIIIEINKRLKLNRKDISRLTTKHNSFSNKLDDLIKTEQVHNSNTFERLNKLDDNYSNMIIDLGYLREQSDRLKSANFNLFIIAILEGIAIIGSYCYIFFK